MIESLLERSNLAPEEKKTFVGLDKLTENEAIELIDYLNKHQIDKITAGIGYSQTDIKHKITREIL